MEAAIIGFIVLLLLAFFGVPLGLTALLVGFGGFAALRGIDPALAMSGQQIMDVATHNGLAVIPLFILMGVFIYRANMSEELYAAGYAWFGHHKGGVAMSTVAACGAFSAVSGSSMASAATMAKVAMPPLRKYGYHDSLSAGSIAAGGTLGIMIPPSVPMIIYGIIAEQDIGRLFIAGVVPGVLLVAAFLVAIRIYTQFRPEMGPPGERSGLAVRLRSLRGTWPIFSLMAVILVGIYLGIFTPTEAAGVGAGFAGLYALLRGRLRSMRDWYACLVDAARTTTALFVVIIGSLVFANFINLSGLPYDLVAFIEGLELSPLGVVLAIAVMCILLGMVFETIGILVLAIPVFLPTLSAMGVDLIWFGIVVIIVIEMGLITPPIGLNAFTVKSVVPDVRLGHIFRGVTIFLIADFAVLLLVVAFPALALWLPGLIR